MSLVMRGLRYVRRLILHSSQFIRVLGIRGAWGFAIASPLREAWLRAGRRYPVTFSKPDMTVWLRAGSSDRMVLDQVFVTEEYAPLRRLKNVGNIFDLGANCGISSLWFLRTFPDSRITCVEPDPSNVEALRRNLAPYSERVRIHAKAVWSAKTTLSLIRDDGPLAGAWATQVRATDSLGPMSVETCTIAELIADAESKPIDILKVDIEGAESELFSVFHDWSELVRCLAIELHGDEMRTTCRRLFEPRHWELVESGELWILFRVAEGR